MEETNLKTDETMKVIRKDLKGIWNYWLISFLVYTY
jgi:hypothetical protein